MTLTFINPKKPSDYIEYATDVSKSRSILNEDGIWSARIWIDLESFQVFKCEIEGVPIDGYDEMLNECAILNIEPIFLTTHEYRQEKTGILFPSHSLVRVAYPGVDYRGAIDKIRIDLDYDNYKFFTVETDQEVKKDDT